jgi:ribonuclease BN (tRNA processing enzyme)
VGTRVPVLCLGSGAALGDGRLWNSFLIDGQIVLDLPTTAIPQLLKLGVDLTQIGHVFISHLHADHMFGIPFLLLEYCVRRQRTEPLYLIGPVGLEAVTQRLCDIAWPDLQETGFEPRVPLRFLEIAQEGTYEAGGREFEAIPMEHYDLLAFGYRFQAGGRLFAYSGDAGEGSDLNRLFDRADVAISERTHPQRSADPGHLDVETVRALAARLRQQGTTIFATHINGNPPPIDGVTVCEDGKTYWVGSGA